MIDDHENVIGRERGREGGEEAQRQAGNKIPREQIKEFLHAYYANLDDDDLQTFSAAQLADTALRHLLLGLKRNPQQTLLEIHNATASATETSPHTIINVIADDLPFLVDSICMVLARFGLNIHLMVHPVLTVARTGHGLWRGLSDNAGKESWQRYEIDRVNDAQKLSELRDAIESALHDVSSVCNDWLAMRKRVFKLGTG